MPSQRLNLADYVAGVRSGNRLILSRAITLIESQLASDRKLSRQLLDEVSSKQRDTIRLAITGVPGVGKSTFIEAFGSLLTSLNKKVAVLSVDPTSQRTKGSIMGDKTRMDTLAHDPLAFVRPSPTGGFLGGVTNNTAETILLCEAAGFDIIIVETVGVGQSETIVRNMVDCFLLLMLPGAGDELQGIKRGIMEMADILIINKADTDPLKAKQAQVEYQNALHLFPPAASGWYPPVLTCSAIKKTGLEKIWQTVTDFRDKLTETNYWQQQRKSQQISRMHQHIEQQLLREFYESPQLKQLITAAELSVKTGKIHPATAAEKLLDDYRKKSGEIS